MRITNINKNDLYFTSDNHFHHKNIIEYCNRPWGDIRTHDSALIQLWNSVVPKNGIVFCGGDFIFTSNIEWVRELVSKLNGKIYLTLGNHCMQNRLDRPIFKEIFADVQDMYYLTIQDEEIKQGCLNFLISHYPMMYWRPGYIHLHGHVHSGPNSTANEIVPFHTNRYDIGVDAWNYSPISYYELREVIIRNNKVNNIF